MKLKKLLKVFEPSATVRLIHYPLDGIPIKYFGLVCTVLDSATEDCLSSKIKSVQIEDSTLTVII